MILDMREADLDLQDFEGDVLNAVNGTETVYEARLIPKMTRYNRQLLKAIFEREE